MARGKRPAFARDTMPVVSSESFEQYLADIRDLPLIATVEEERAIARRARAGDPDAIERMVTGNLRFVIAFVKRYQGHGLDIGDLVAVGNAGLLRAVRKFDPERGVKFISYAVWWVRQAVLKALAEQPRAVRLPLNQNTAVLRFSRQEGALAQKLGRTPNERELSAYLAMSIDQVRNAQSLFTTEVSLDAPVGLGEAKASTLVEQLSVGGDNEIEVAADSRLKREFIDRLFSDYLTERERDVLRLYFGLDTDDDPLTLQEIGERLGVTRERVRQVKERAFKKLRLSDAVRQLGAA